MNKLNYKRNIFLVSFIIGISLLLMTCDPGLGKAVDTQAPKVAIELPVTKSVLKGGFTMKGIATDEIRVAECFVTFKNIKTSQSYKYMAAVANGEFTVSINDPKADGSFELPDGDYNVTVTVSDAYRNSTADVVYTIDNTAPTVLITSPNSYSVSNWPNMYKNFNIKGEVYDSSTLESVTVYLVDEEGKILKSVIADGTNTFLASFETPFEEEKICFYYAVAKDAGGNENTYCYHKSDIFQLISAEKNGNAVEQRTETNIVFPSINTIGYVDQGNSGEILIGSIGKEKLIAKKIENTSLKVVEGKYVFPGFNYYKENASQIKWLNISNDVSQIAGIGIGAPVLGTIMPPTDGSAIKYESVYVWVARVGKEFKDVEEFKTPEEFKQYLNESMFTEANKLESCVISEGEKGNKQVKLTAVGESLNFQVDSSKPGEEENNWVSGYYYIKVQFTTESGVTTSDYCKFEVTAGAPVLTEGLFAKGKEKASYYRGYTTANTIEEGLGGIALTSDLSSPVKVDWYYSGITTTGKEVSSKVETISPEEDGTYVIPIKHEEDGEYTYTLTAASDTDLSTVISRVVVVDATAPVVEFSNISEGDILETSEITVKGNIDDANGIEKVEWKLQENGTGGTWQEIAKAKASFQQELSKLKENVEYTIKIRATDVAGNVSGEESYKCKFTIDVANPVASIDSPKPEENTSIVFVKDIPVFSGKASDAAVTTGKKASSASLSYRKDGGTEVAVPTGTTTGQFNWDQSSGSWSWSPTTSQFNGTGKYDVTIKVTDNAGKTTSESRTVSLDTIVPTIKLTQVSSYVENEDYVSGKEGSSKYYVNGDIVVKFDVVENDYIKEIKLYRPDGSADGQDLGTNSQVSIKFATADYADGTKLGEFKLVVTDRSGNEGVYTGSELTNYEINQDTDKPRADIEAPFKLDVNTAEDITAENNLFSTKDTIEITLKDDDGVSSGTYQIDSLDVKTINGGNAKTKTEIVSFSNLQQGPHSIKLSVKDINGRENSTKTFYFGIDDTAPELIIDGYQQDETDINSGYQKTSFDITGQATDTYELKNLIYSYIDATEETSINRKADGSWTIFIEKPETSQKKTIKFIATDKFFRTTVKTFTYVFDLDKPNLVVKNADKVEDKYFNQNQVLPVEGTADDVIENSAIVQSGLKYVQYGLGTGHNAETADSVEWTTANGSSEWTVLLNIPQHTDGLYTLFVKAEDNSGNESEVQKFNIIADSTLPEITAGGSSEISETIYTRGGLSLKGTVTEKNLEKLTYTYSTEGRELESNVGLDVKGQEEEKTWELRKTSSELTEGTHVYKIFATDKAGNQSTITRTVIVDKIAPEITTNVTPQIMYDNGKGEELTVNGTISVNVRVTETNELKGVYYTNKDTTSLSDESDWSSEISFTETELAAGKTIIIDTTEYADNTKLPLRIKAEDAAGNYTVMVVNPVINQTSDKPSIAPSNFKELSDIGESGVRDEENINIFGVTNPNMIFIVSDDDAVKEYWVNVDDRGFEKVSTEVNSSQQVINYSLNSLIEENKYGRHKIEFRVKDINCADDLSTRNNYVEKTYYIAIDDGAPELQLSNVSGQYVGSEFTIRGSVSDKNGIKEIVVKAKDSGTKYHEFKYEEIKESQSYEYNFKVPEKRETIIIRAYDTIGNSSAKELIYYVDTTNPEVSVNKGAGVVVENNTILHFIDGDSPNLRVEGSAQDVKQNASISPKDTGISGIDQVRLKIGSPIRGVDDAETYLASGKVEEGSMTWSYNLDFTENVKAKRTAIEKGESYTEPTVYVRSFDKAGNNSEESSFLVYLDIDLPELTITTSHTESNGIINLGTKNTGFSIEGRASDLGGLESVTAKIQGATGELEGSYTEGTGEWRFDIPLETNDGQLTILVTAKDKCGKTSQKTLTAVFDKTKPEISFSNLENDNILPRKTYTVNGSVSDVNGIAKVEYQLVTDGTATNWVEVAGASTSFNVELTNLEINKNYTLKLRATDKAGNITGEEENIRNFILNKDEPVIKINSISPQVNTEGEISVNGKITVKATVTDTNGISSAYYTYDEELLAGSDWSSSENATAFSSEAISSELVIEIDTTEYADKANLPLRIKVVDEAENYAVSIVDPYVNQELDKPSIAPSNFKELSDIEDPGLRDEENINVFGVTNPNMIFIVSDDDAVKEYWVNVDDSGFEKVSTEVNSSQQVINYSLNSLIEENKYGRHKIEFRVKDINCADDLSTKNNYVEKTYYIAIDDGAPELQLSNVSGQYVGSEFTIRGSVSDKNGIKEIVVKAKDSGTKYHEFKYSESKESQSYEYNFKVPEKRETIIITAYDTIGNSSAKELIYYVDTTKPEVSVNKGAGVVVENNTILHFIDGDSPNLRVDGSAQDVKQKASISPQDTGISGIDQVRLKIGSPISGENDAETYLASGKVEEGSMTWSYNLDFTENVKAKRTAIEKGESYTEPTVYVRSFDKAGNKSDEESFLVYLDIDLPELTLTTTHTEANGIINLGTKNTGFSIEGSASDLGGLESVTAKIQGATGELEGSYTEGTGEWRFVIPSETNDGQLTILVTAKDKCGKTSQATLTAVLDKTKPEITFSNLEAGKILPRKTYTVNGSVSDVNGIAKVEYQLVTDGTATNWGEVAGASTSFNVELSNLEINKNYTLKLRATDKAGNITGDEENTRTFTLNSDNPNIVTSYTPVVSNGQETSVNGTIKVKVSASDTNAIVSAWYTYDEGLSEESDWATSGKATSIIAEEITKGKEIEVDTTKYTDKANLPLRIKVVDEAENYTVSSVSPYVNQELDIPSISPSNFKKLGALEEAGWDVSGATNVFPLGGQNMIFTVSDDDSVKSCSVKVDEGAYSSVSTDVNSSQKTILYPVSGLEYGRHTITIKVEDEYGKSVEEIYYIAMDDGEPELNLSIADNQYVGSSFDITGTVEDANGIDIIEIYSESDKLYASTKDGDFTLGNDGRFSYGFRVPEEKERIVIIATDDVGNKSSVKLTYKVDSTSPSLTVANGANAFVDGDTPTLRVSGTASDKEQGSKDTGISGIDQVRIKIGSSITGKNDADSYLAVGKVVEGVMDWSYNLDFTDKAAGTYSVYIQAFDIAGNVSNEQTITVYVDTDAPTLTHSYTNKDVGTKNSTFTIEGTATDASGVKSVTAKIQGASGNLEGTFTPTSNGTPASWRFTIPGNSGDGQKTILVTAKDGCGKTVQETFTATLDTKVPEVTFTDISDDDNNNETIETSKTTDKPSVSVTYSDITSGVKTIDYSFYYFDKIKGTFVNYATENPNASGTFTRGSSFSGSVKLRMAEQTTTSSGAFIYSDTYTDGKWYVKVTVTDEAGNVATYDSPYFYVDQHKPTLNVTEPTDLALKKQDDSLTVKGTTADDFNGEIDRVVVKVTHPNYNPSQLEQFTKTFTKDERNGTELLTSNDNKTYEFSYEWKGINSPFIYPNEYEIIVTTYDIAGNEVSLPKKVSCDSTAPTISFSLPYSYSVDSYGKDSVGSVVNSPIGMTYIKALASDYSMDSIYYQFGGNVEIEETGKGTNDYKITKITIEGGGAGSDSYGESKENPSSDNLASGVLMGTWNKLKAAKNDFYVECNTLALHNSGKTYHISGDDENIMTLDVHLVAVDEAGNINYCKMPLKVDTDTDKPTLLVLSPKTINDVANVGGTATVSGTVNDDNAVHSVWMQVKLSSGNYIGNILTGKNSDKFGIDYSHSDYGITKPESISIDEVNKTFTSPQEDSAYFQDKTKWYKVNLGTPTSSSTTWNMVLNKKKEFDNGSLYDKGFLLNNVAQTELTIRIIALDTKSGNETVSSDAKLGDISEFTLKIDSGSPSIVINNIADFPTEGSYIGGMLNFDITFSDDEAITEWNIEATSTAGGDNRSMILFSDKYSTSYEYGLGDNIHVVKSIDTDAIYRECGNVIQIKISAKDNSKDSQSNMPAEKESSLTFKYTIDNAAPEAQKDVATIDGKTYRIDTETVIGDPGSHREPSDRHNYLRILSDQAQLKGNVFDEANGSGVDYVMLYFTKNGYLYNPSEKDTKTLLSHKVNMRDENGGNKEVDFPVSSLDNISRTPSANKGNVTPYIIIDRAEGLIDTSSNGDLDGYDENIKSNGEWIVYIKSSNLPDGVYDIHYVVVDHAKNARYYHDKMLVQNNAPKITSIVLATDINGDGTVDISADGTSDEDKKFDTSMGFKETGFNVRNSKLKIKVNVTGGKEPLKYFLRYKTTSEEVTTDENDPGYTTGIFEVTSFLGDSGTPVDYVVWVEDSVEQNLSLTSGKTTIDMILDNVDEVKPVAQLFELNTDVESSKDKNDKRGSLYKENGSVQGHIEPRDCSLVDNVSITKKDPEVSGTIILRGEVMDDQRIGSITLTLGDKTKQIAKWNGSSLDVVNEGGENRATLIKNELGLSGHYVEWSYVWDTWDILGNVCYDTPVKVLVTDYSGNSRVEKEYTDEKNIPRTEGNKFDKDKTPWGYNYITMDVVPYITKIETPNRIKSGLKKNNIRSSSGKYSIIKGDTSDFIKVYGFNLNASDVRIVDSTEVTEENGPVSASTGNAIELQNPVSPYKELSLSNNSSVSGYLEIIVNGIRSINNINKNDESYNQEPDESIKNTILNDDRYLRFFDMKDTGIKNGYYPTMIMEGNDPVFGYIDLKGGPNNNTGIGGKIDNGGAGTYSADHAMPQRAKINGTDGSRIYTEYLIKASIWDQMGMARDESGRFHHITTYNRAGARMSYIYDRYAELYTRGKGWGSGTGYAEYDGSWSDEWNNNAISLEDLSYGNGLMLGRYQYPKIIARGNSVTGDASIYMLYFDANTTNKELIFRNFQVGTNSAVKNGNALYAGGLGSDGTPYNQYSTTNDNRSYNGEVSTNLDERITAAKGASNHFSFDVTAGYKRVVLVYYDETLGRLVMRFSTGMIDGSNPKASQEFKDSSIVFPDYVGAYVSMCLDSKGGVHISALDTSDSDLVYIYVDFFEGTNYKMVRVDQASAVGNWTQIKLNKAGVPYIAYYNATEAGGRESIKLAYANNAITSVNTVVEGVDSDGYTTGNWEYMTVPAITAPQGGKSEFQNVCLDFDSTGKPVVGYLGDNLEFGTWCDE